MKDAVSVIAEFFFDVCGIFIPGLAFLSAVCWMGFIPPTVLPNDIYGAIGLALASYLVGHLFFAISQRLVAWMGDRTGIEPRKTLLENEKPLGKALRSRIKNKWRLSTDASDATDITSPEVLYELCRNYVHVRDNERSSFLRKEQTYGELSRSMVIVFLFCAILLWLSPKPLAVQLPGTMAFVAGAAVFFLRYLTARHADAGLVYTNFIVLLEEEEEMSQCPRCRPQDMTSGSSGSSVGESRAI